MPFQTPFHTRTSTLNQNQEWRDWSGYLAAGLYEHSHEREYYAARNAAALFDVTPLFKYEVTGPDALRLVDRVMTRDIAKCAIGQVMYSPWCDDEGKVIDDGTIARLGDNHFRITSAHPNRRWFQDCGYGLDATVEDVSTQLAALSLQGPRAREVLKLVTAGVDLDTLKYFRLGQAQIAGFPMTITRTGYTGDLGYELWVASENAPQLWDILLEKGAGYGLAPAGLVALDIVRIEAGLLLVDVDYISSAKAVIESQKSSPFEIGLGWAVALDKPAFVGRKALLAEKERGSKWQFIGLEIDWVHLEQLFNAVDLPPKVTGRASRVAVPIYKNGKQIGQVTSSTFSPVLKKYVAIGTVESRYAALGSEVEIEVTVEYSRERGKARIVKTPFFNPERKRA